MRKGCEGWPFQLFRNHSIRMPKARLASTARKAFAGKRVFLSFEIVKKVGPTPTNTNPNDCCIQSSPPRGETICRHQSPQIGFQAATFAPVVRCCLPTSNFRVGGD